ncbi:MAG: hypothetical protein K2N36_07775 [Ruminiclostridium sp.]|nr:hypothetical protein [Ruminiclostridium sp.]
MARKKKVSGLSVAIVALNIVIVGIIILLIALIYLHIKEDTGNLRGETTTVPAVTEPDASDTANDTQPSDTQQQDESTTPAESAEETAAETEDSPISPTYDPAFFENDLFIGDSISTGLYLYDYLKKDNVFAEVGLNPESASTREIDGETCIQRAQRLNAKHIYIMLGSNGLAFLEADYMAAKMGELVDKLKASCPSAQVCIISISPVTKAHEAEGAETMSKVKAYNTALEKVCGTNGCKYVDLCSLLLDDEGYFADKYAEEDGLHFKGNTYKLLLSTVQKAVQ